MKPPTDKEIFETFVFSVAHDAIRRNKNGVQKLIFNAMKYYWASRDADIKPTKEQKKSIRDAMHGLLDYES